MVAKRPRQSVPNWLLAMFSRRVKRARSGGASSASVAKAFRVNKRVAARPIIGSGSVVQQLGRIKRYLGKQSPEIKYFDVALTQADIGDPGSVLHISGIAQGDTLATRTANSITVKSITVRGRLNYPVAITPTGNSYYRLALVVDLQQVPDTAPALTDVFDQSDPTFIYPNENNLGRFRYLWLSAIYDPRRLAFATGLATTTVPTQSPWFSFTWQGNLVVRYNGTAATDIQKNGIYFIVITTDLNDALDITGVARIGYTDD